MPIKVLCVLIFRFPVSGYPMFHANFPWEGIGPKLVGLPRPSLLHSRILHVNVLYVDDILRHVD